MLESILHPLITWVTDTIGSHGLIAVFGLMTLESTGVLIPSEAISPFAGYLVSVGKMGFIGAAGAGIAGNLFGSWIAYFIGLWGGREIWTRYGRFVGVRAHHLDSAEKWFAKYGDVTVFVSRMLPGIRTFISFPAGIAQMNFAKFTLYTLAGCVPWVTALTYVGYLLGKNWEKIGSVIHYLDYVVALGIVAAIVYLFFRWRSSKA